jgi:hypothetical protein
LAFSFLIDTDWVYQYLSLQSLPETTYQEHSKEVFLKKEFEAQETRKQMLDEDTFAHADIDR